MDPWKIIGWLLLFAAVLWVIWTICRLIWRARIPVIRYYLHLKTRNITPKEGQKWWQEGAVLRIGQRYPKGHFNISSGCASWGETNEDWKQRVRSRRLFLIGDEK